MDWLADEVHEIRKAACENLKLLAMEFDENWLKTALIPKLTSMATSTNYLHRLTTLSCIRLLSSAVKENILTNDLLRVCVMPLGEDPVPNVRFNVANCLSEAAKYVDAKSKEDVVKLLKNMCS